MKKTLLTLFTTIAVCGMSYSQVYAQIDVSVFENKADYDVDMDDFDDTGEISFVGGDNMPSGTVIGNPDGDSGYISGELDIKIIDDGNIAAPRMTLLYTGDDWIFTDKIIIKTESHRYTSCYNRISRIISTNSLKLFIFLRERITRFFGISCIYNNY